MNKGAHALSLNKDSLTVVCLAPDIISAEHIEIAEFVITDELLTSCSHAKSRYRMYLIIKTKKFRT